jgi:hypothetical protein
LIRDRAGQDWQAQYIRTMTPPSPWLHHLACSPPSPPPDINFSYTNTPPTPWSWVPNTYLMSEFYFCIWKSRELELAMVFVDPKANFVYQVTHCVNCYSSLACMPGKLKVEAGVIGWVSGWNPDI